jgi:hypothetical protein
MPYLNAPVVALSFDGRFELFIPWTDGNIYHKWVETATFANNPLGTWITNWYSHGKRGTGFRGPLGLIHNDDGRLELFARTADGQVYHKWQLSRGGAWGDWVSLVAGTEFVVGRNSDGRLEVFFISTSGGLGHIWQLSPNGGWSGAVGLPPPALTFKTPVKFSEPPTVAPDANGRLHVFVRGDYDNKTRLFHFYQTTLGLNPTWSTYNVFNDSSGLTASGPVLGASADKRLELFALGDRSILHAWQTSTGGWSNWFLHENPNPGYVLNRPAPLASHADPLATHVDGKLALRFVSGDDEIAAQVFGKKQVVASGPWTNWFVDSPQGIFSDPAMTRSVDDRLYLFVVGFPSLRTYYKWEKEPDGEWSVPAESLNWPTLGRPS